MLPRSHSKGSGCICGTKECYIEIFHGSCSFFDEAKVEEFEQGVGIEAQFSRHEEDLGQRGYKNIEFLNTRKSQ